SASRSWRYVLDQRVQSLEPSSGGRDDFRLVLLAAAADRSVLSGTSLGRVLITLLTLLPPDLVRHECDVDDELRMCPPKLVDRSHEMRESARLFLFDPFRTMRYGKVTHRATF